MGGILYLENDYLTSDLAMPELARYGIVRMVDNEHDFREAIDDIAKTNAWPSLVVLEQRVKWTHPEPTMPERPASIKSEGQTNAGIRCYDYLRSFEGTTRKIPVIFYCLDEILPVLEARGIREDSKDFQWVKKDAGFGSLHEAIRRVLQG